MSILPQPSFDAQAPITLEEAKSTLATGLFQEDPALKLTLGDTIRAENYTSSKEWVLNWTTATALYQSPYSPRYWEGTQVERASVPFYTVATAVNGLVPQILNGLFYENPPFLIAGRPRTRAQAARAVGAILAYQLDEINFREEVRLGITNALLFGTAIWKYGWESYTRDHVEFRRKQQPLSLPNPLAGVGPSSIQVHDDDDDNLEEVTVTEYVDRPCFESIVNLRQVLVDPTLNVPDIQKAKYVIHRMYQTINDLEKLRDREGFKIPSKEELLELFFAPKEPVEEAPGESDGRNPAWDARADGRSEEATEDPFNQPLEVLERWDSETYIVVLQKKLVLCNVKNPYSAIPFFSLNWWDVPEAFYGLGLARTIGTEQRLQQGITNAWLDQMTLNLNGVYVRVRGKNVPTQSIRISPGKIIDVDDKDGFKPLDRTQAVPEAEKHLALSQSRAETVSGANDISTQGQAGSSGHSNLARSSAGAQLLGSGAGSRVGEFVDKFANQVFVPFLYAAHELNRQMLPMSQMRYILDEELEHEYMDDPEADMLELLNARAKFSISAGSKMQARRAMAQSMPLLIQFLTNQQTENQLAIQGKKVDLVEILRSIYEVSEWKNFNDVIVDMTPQDQARMQQQSPQAAVQAKTQAQKELLDKQQENKLAIVDSENTARAAREVLRATFEKAAQPIALSGEPDGTAFGSSA